MTSISKYILSSDLKELIEALFENFSVLTFRISPGTVNVNHSQLVLITFITAGISYESIVPISMNNRFIKLFKWECLEQSIDT